MVAMQDHFWWATPRSGFEVIDLYRSPRNVEGRVIQPIYRKETKPAPHFRDFDVYSDMTLYRRFAKLALPEQNESEVVAFANEYGLLDISFIPPDLEKLKTQTINEQSIQMAVPDAELEAEPITKWSNAITSMRMAIEWWDGIRLRKDPHHWLLGNWMTTHLSQTCGVRVELQGEHTGITHIPRSLYGAMWLQLAHHVDIGAGFRPCEFCGDLFAILPNDKRTARKRTCSDSCKKARQRQRGNDDR